MEMESALAKWFGYPNFRPLQKEILQCLFGGQSVLAMLPTGFGKSLLYQFYGGWTGKKVLIISPLLALMQDQVHELNQRFPHKAMALTSVLSQNDKTYALQHLDQYDYLFLSPEMATNTQVRACLVKQSFGLFVVDEVHCLYQWGFDFRPEYLALKDLYQDLGRPTGLYLSATLPRFMRPIIEEGLGWKPGHLRFFQAGMGGGDQSIYILDRETDQDLEGLKTSLTHMPAPILVYFMNIAHLEEAHAWMVKETGWRIGKFHSRLDKEEKDLMQNQFREGDLDMLFATSAFGMGVHHPRLQSVIHYQLPDSIEDFVQQIGRAGRNGKGAMTLAFLDSQFAYQVQARLQWTYRHLLGTDRGGDLSPAEQALEEVGRLLHLGPQDLNKMAKLHYQRKEDQIKTFLNFLSAPECRRVWLTSYLYGLQVEACGACDRCQPIQLDQLPSYQHPKGQGKREGFWQDRLGQLFPKNP